MINALGVLGYGVGGIEAEAVLLGQPLYQPMPRDRRRAAPPASCRSGSTATDLVLVVTEMLRAHGVVGAFVEFAGDGLAGLSLADRATISNMSPEFGATSTLFPIDDETLAYLRLTGRTADRVDLVERYAKEQGLWREPGHGPDVRRAARARPRDRSSRRWPARAGRRTGSACGPPRQLPTRRSPTASMAPDDRVEAPVDGDRVEEASAESFPASDPTVVRGRRCPMRQRLNDAAPRDAVAGGVDQRRYPAVTIEVDGERRDPARARWRSRRSPRARTPPTRP